MLRTERRSAHRGGPRALVVALAGLLGSAGVAEAGPRHNYYAFTDDDGVLHVTNVPGRREGDWSLWKSLEGSGSRPSAPGRGEPATPAGHERQHRYDSFIRGAASRYSLPEALIRAVIHTESNYHDKAVSRAGALGLMQLMPSTARSLGVEQPLDPRENIYGGARYLRLLANRYEGDMILVLAAYNAGAGNVEKYGGVPPYEETRAYVRSVLRRYYAYERQSQLGADRVQTEPARHVTP